jgi:enoyl-[acyl-carrier protein] reductase I
MCVTTCKSCIDYSADEWYDLVDHPIQGRDSFREVLPAKSFGPFSRVRFNTVVPDLLKTSASAGIPGYVDAYLYAEHIISRKKAVQTEEAANSAAFLSSPRSSGINAQRLVVDAGMAINYFDRKVVEKFLE